MGIFSQKLNSASIGLLYRQLAIMIASDVSIPEAFQLLGDESENKHIRNIAAAISKDLGKGVSVGDILQKYPKVFNEFVIDMLQRTEEKSKVSEALIHLADAIEDTSTIRAKLARALFFPIVTLAFGFIFFLVVAIFVLPVFEEMFAGLGGHLPGPTQVLLNISNWVEPNVLYLMAAIVIFFILLIVNRKFANFVGGLIPGFRKLSKWSSLISFSKHLSVMLTFELPINSAMHKAASTVKNKIHARKFAAAADTVSEIKQLNQALLTTGIFSKITLQMIGYGARSNTLTLALDEIIKFYEKDFDRSLNRFLGVLEIMAIIGTGIVIGYFVIAVYLPIFRMTGAAAM